MSNGTSKFSNLVLGVASTGPVLVALCALLLGLGVPWVTDWFWPAPTTNVAEAAALGDAARVRALAAQGARLDAPLPIRPDFLEDDAPPTMSPLEAAIRRRSDSLVQVLLELGVRPQPPEVRRLYCLALNVEAQDVVDLLQKTLTPTVGSCSEPAPAAGAEG